jgi:4-amino-4-deoxy-L-arabinose transferase
MKRSGLVVIALFLLLYILPLGVRPLVIPDETRYAEIPREMLASGDWVVPRLDGLRYFEKPVLGYWLNAAAMTIFGQNSFAARFPSAVAVGFSALFLFALARRFAGGYLAAILTAVAFLTCMEVFALGIFNVLDSALSFFITAAMVSFFYAYTEENSRRERASLALMGVFCGLAFLTKGFLAFAVPVAAIAPFMIWEGRWRELFKIPWVPILFAVLVALPWSILIHLREPSFWHYFFWIEHIHRFASPIGGQHPKPFWFFVPVILGGALPWTALIPAAISGLREMRLRDTLLRFALCWLLFPFLFFSASQGKLGTYILPCFPPLVILLIIGVLRYLERGGKRAFSIGVLVLAVLPAGAAAALLLNQITGFPGFRVYGPGETWKWLLAAAVLLLWTALSVLATRTGDFRRSLVLFCSAPLLLMFTGHFIIPDLSKKRKMPEALLLRQADKIRSDTVLVSENHLVPAVCWFYKRSDVYLLDGSGEFAWGLSYDSAKHRELNHDEFTRLAIKESGKNRLILVTFSSLYDDFRHLLPKPALVDTYGRFVFVQF